MTEKLLHALADMTGLTIEVGAPLKPYAQELMDTLGVTVIVKDGAPTRAPESFHDPHDKKYRRRRRVA